MTTTSDHRTTPSTAEPAPDRPLRGRRLSWEEFERVYGPRSRPANDNKEVERDAARQSQNARRA